MNVVGIVYRSVALLLAVVGGIALWGARELSEVAGVCRERSAELPEIANQLASTTGWPRHELPAKVSGSPDPTLAVLRRLHDPYPDRTRAVDGTRQEGSLYAAVANRLERWVRLLLAIGGAVLASAAALIGLAAARRGESGHKGKQ